MVITKWNSGDFEGVEAMQEEVVRGWTRIYGDNHPRTQTSVNVLVGIREDISDPGRTYPVVARQGGASLFKDLT